MKICFYAWSSYNKLTIELNKKICGINPNISSIFIVNTEEEEKNIKQSNKDAIVYNSSQYIKNNWNDFTFEKFKEIEKKFDIKSIWELLYSDRFLIHKSYEYNIKICVGMFEFFNWVFEVEKPDYFYNEVIAVFASYAAYYAGLRNNVKYISQMVTRTHGATHHYFLCDQFQLNMNFNENYKNEPISDELLGKADDYLRNFENYKLKPELMSFTGTKPKFRIAFGLNVLLYIKRYITKNKGISYDYINEDNDKQLLNPLKFYFRYLIMKRKFMNGKPLKNQKFAFLPLHYQPEASTLVCAEKYEKQLFLIDSVAKSLPADTVLYVKEHYALLGHKPISFYSRLKEYPNVKLINPWYDSHALIKDSEAIIVLTGTAGFEAMLYRKPVIVLGNIFFKNAPSILQTDDIYSNYIDLVKTWKQPERSDIVMYLAECFRTMYEGCTYTTKEDTCTEPNISKLALSLNCQLKKIENERKAR